MRTTTTFADARRRRDAAFAAGDIDRRRDIAQSLREIADGIAAGHGGNAAVVQASNFIRFVNGTRPLTREAV